MRTFLQMSSLFPAHSLDLKAILEALKTSVRFNQINMFSLLYYLVSGWVDQTVTDKSVQVVNVNHRL